MKWEIRDAFSWLCMNKNKLDFSWSWEYNVEIERESVWKYVRENSFDRVYNLSSNGFLVNTLLI